MFADLFAPNFKLLYTEVCGANLFTKNEDHNLMNNPLSLNLAYLQTHLLRLDLPLRLAVRRAQQAGFDPQNEFQGLYISEVELERYLTLAPGMGLWDSQYPLPEFDETYQTEHERIIRQIQDIEANAQANNEILHLDYLRRVFALSLDDFDILLLGLAPALDRRYERLYGFLQDDVTKREPTVNLILNLLGQNWSRRTEILNRLTDTAPLLKYGFVQLTLDASSPTNPMSRQILNADPRIVTYVQGLDTLPQKWQTFLRTYAPTQTLDDLVLADETRQRLRQLMRDELALFYFSGGYGSGKRAIAQALAYENNYAVLEVDAAALKTEFGREIHDYFALAWREGILRQAILFISRWETLLDEDKRPPHLIWEAMLNYPYPVIISARAPWEAFGTHRQRPMLRLELNVPDYQYRLQHWQFYLSETKISPAELAYKFKLTGGQIRDAVHTAYDLAAWRGEATPTLTDLYAGSRAQSNRNLSELAVKISPRYAWEQLILPPDPLQQLHEVSDRMQHAVTVYESWGFEGGSANARGLVVLFAGPSGTGKTMAAEVIAHELGLEIFKIDLSSVVSKYIGETEKNLAKIFDEAAQSNAILFFDEADALFGKRTEVSDSHDRYANIEVGYLLQRLETYDGIGVLATNLRQNIDEAFTRRMDFLVDFPFPEEVYRERIWQVSYPANAPLGTDVDFRTLAARFRLSGGNIRNAVLASAFLAAADNSPTINMRHVMQGVRREYQKMGKLIDDELGH